MEKDKVNQLRVDKQNLDKKLNELKEINLEKIYYLEEEMNIIKTEINFIRNIQREYYTKLLKVGNDVRGKGLVWIIETMWDLDFKVDENMLPDKIDSRSKKFIMDISDKDYKLMKLKNEYQQYKIMIKNILDKV